MKDRGKNVKKTVITNPKVLKLIEATKEVAKKTGCALLNLFEAMGGPGLMASWRKADPPLVSEDYGHVTEKGAERIGNIISKSILNHYNEYEKNININK